MKLLIAVMLVLVTAGCADKPLTPPGIIPPDKMEKVMYDMLRSGEFLSGYVLYKDTGINKVAESMKWYTKVWEMHKITEADFRKSYQWYQQNPSMMLALMDSIQVLPAPPVNVPKPDSIQPLVADTARRRLDSTRQLLLRNREQRKDSIRKARTKP